MNNNLKWGIICWQNFLISILKLNTDCIHTEKTSSETMFPQLSKISTGAHDVTAYLLKNEIKTSPRYTRANLKNIFTNLLSIFLQIWIFGDIWCSIWLAIDVWMCTASILNLCAISLDRYLAVTKPVTYPNIMTPYRAKILIASVWILSFVICLPPLIGWRDDYPVSNVYVKILKFHL